MADEVGAGEPRASKFLVWDDWRTPLEGVIAILICAFAGALTLGIVWGLGYRVAKLIGGW